MSFVGAIGHLMNGSGLSDILELVCAKDSILHMLSGKAISRALRTLFLVDAALHATLFKELFTSKR